jgi:hypothetical protein
MRHLLLILALLLAPLAIAPACCAGVFYEDEKEKKAKDDGKAREQEEWEAYVKKLGKGPIYRVEVLFRDYNDGTRLNYCRDYVSPDIRSPNGLFGLALDENGKVVPARDLDRRAAKEPLRTEVSKDSKPLALRTRYVWITLNNTTPENANACIFVTQSGRRMPMPKKLGDVEVRFSKRAVFRVELVSAEDVLKLGPLRQDAQYFHDRTDALKQDILKTHRKQIDESESSLAEAAHVFRDAELIDAVRGALDRCIELKPADFRERSFPSQLTSCLAALGDEREVATFQRLAQRHTECTPSLIWPALNLTKRVGGAKTLPLLEELARNPTAAYDTRQQIVRQLDPKLPQPTHGDVFVVEVVRLFQLKPDCFGLVSTERRLDQVLRGQPRPPGWEDLCHASGSDYLFLTEGDRKRNIETLLEWLKDHQPPAKP